MLASLSPASLLSRRKMLWGSVLLMAFAGWLLFSLSGLRAAAGVAGWLSGGRLHIEAVSGRLWGKMQLGRLAWETPELALRAENVELAWHPSELLAARLHLSQLSVGRLQIDSPSSSTPTPLPTSLRLPVELLIDQFSLAELRAGDSLLLGGLQATVDSRQGLHRLVNARAQVGHVRVQAQGEIATAAPFALKVSANLQGTLADSPFQLDIAAAGTLAEIALRAEAGEGRVSGKATATLTPFAAQPFSALRATLAGFDPADWWPGAPQAQLSLQAELQPAAGSLSSASGSFSIDNRLPGALDKQRLPFARLSGKLDWRGDQAEFRDLLGVIEAQGGRLEGRAQLTPQRRLDLQLKVQGLDLAAVHSAVRPTRLAGNIDASLSGERQSLDLALSDARFGLTASLQRQGDRLDIEALRLSARQASLEAKGKLNLAPPYRFAASGQLRHFDPALFARLPAADLNASFSGEGRLHKGPAVKLVFDLGESRLAGQPLSGGGQLDIDWPVAVRANLQLNAGTNRLSAQGVFGRPEETLAIEIAAPKLTPFGIDGDLAGQLRLSGTATAPNLNATLQSRQLALAGFGGLRELGLSAAFGAAPDAPLLLNLRVAAIDRPGEKEFARKIDLRAEGSNSRHRLDLDLEFPGRAALHAAAGGGLSREGGGQQWQGQLQEFSWQPTDKARRIVLAEAAPLRLAADGWRFGPARLKGDVWQATVAGNAARGRLQLSAESHDPALGDYSASLEAALRGLWQLDREREWRGELRLAASRLDWLAPLLGDNWQSGGRLQGNLHLSGTPARPLVEGGMQGEQLALRLIDQGLRLENGRLEASVVNNRLSIRDLSFDSPLTVPPQPLKRENVAALIAQPGKLSIQGETRIDRNGQSDAFLDVRLERLGVFQTPERWVVLSGNGRLNWLDESLAISGKAKVDAGVWRLARQDMPSLSDDVVVRSAKGESAPKALRPRARIDVEADLGERFHFAGAGLKSRLAGAVRLQAEGYDLPRASGSIRTEGGAFDAYGQQLVIERGILTFQGLLDNPALNVRATRPGLPVEAGVELAGTVRKPIVRLVSEPEMSEAEKLSWLVLGHGNAGGADASVLLAAAGAMFGGESGGALRQIRQGIGIDQFGVRTGQLGDNSGRQSTSRVVGGSNASNPSGDQILSVGKRLSSNAVLSYEQVLGKTESVVKLTVQLNRALSLVGRTGSDNALDLFYTLRFGK